MKAAFTRQQIAKRVQQLGRGISRDYAGRTVDVVIVLENAFLFAADLIREISNPVVCHFVRSETRDIRAAGHPRREVFFSVPPALRGRDVLVIDAVLSTGVTQDFLLKRLEEGRPRSIRLAVLFDRPSARKVNLQPEYAGFAVASKQWTGYGLSDSKGQGRNWPYVGASSRPARKARTRGSRKSGAGSRVSRG